MKRKMIEIDGGRLNKVFANRSMSKAIISQDLGYSASYLSSCISYGRIPETIAIMLEDKYGIKRYEYIKTEEDQTTMIIAVAKIEAIIQAIQALTDKVEALERMWN